MIFCDHAWSSDSWFPVRVSVQLKKVLDDARPHDEVEDHVKDATPPTLFPDVEQPREEDPDDDRSHDLLPEDALNLLQDCIY